MLKIELYCPSCSTAVPQREQRRMNSFWGPKPVPCGGCGLLLQYQSSLLSRLRIGGHIFRFGLFVVAVSLALKSFDAASASVLTITAWVGFGAVLIGIFVTATRPDSIRVEVVDGL